MQKSNNKFKDFILKTVCDPVLIYTVIIMMSIMYHYKSEHTVIYGIVSFVIAGLSFRFFDYMKSHKFIGTLGYIALFSAFLYAVGFAQKKGEESYPLSFGVWFLTPQDVLDYSQWYTIVVFLLFLIFMMSVIYYFTRVRYRIFMGFLIFIIPFAIYGKEFEKMPTYFIILLAVSYILIMIQFRQMQDTEETEVVDKNTIWKSVTAYAVVFASIASIVPKPEIEANRDFLDTLISAEQFTDRLTAMLGVFRDDTDGQQFFRSNSNTPLYYVKANASMRLKTTTFSTYNYDDDVWSVEDSDRKFVKTFENTSESVKNGMLEFDETGSILKAVLHAGGLNSEFAEKYGIDGYSESQVFVPETEWISITSNVRGSQFAPVPQLVQNFRYTSYQGRMALIGSGLIYADNSESDSRFAYDERFVYGYTPDTFFMNDFNKSVTDKFSGYDYEKVLSDTLEVLENSEHDEKIFINLISDEIDSYATYDDFLLDYGNSQKIYSLAQEITADYNSDYDKAKAIEEYFRNNDYVYDLEYQKKKGDNAEDFIFTAKRGVCYEYATAMVLLARASGIPARFCEGYNMSQPYNNRAIDTNFVVTGNDAHAFPELYIRGFGWLSFEPTVSSDEIIEEGNTTADSLARAGIIILLSALAVMMFIFLYPAISHRLFIFRYSRKSPNDAVCAIMCRMYRIFGIDRSYTSQETAEIIHNEYNADIYSIAEMFGRAVYGGAVLNDTEREKAMSEYITAYEALKEKKRKRNRK